MASLKMAINLTLGPALGYTSRSQQARVMTESWVASHFFCPNCGDFPLKKYPNNQPVADFVCGKCNEDYELKSKQGVFGSKMVDGGYQTMMDRLAGSRNPNFLLLNYTQSCQVSDFCIVPKHFIVPDLIEKRKPLAATARRAGWIGCNVLLSRIPESGKIFFVRQSDVLQKRLVRQRWERTLFLRDFSEEKKGWLLDTMNCVERLGRNTFSLADVYGFEAELAEKYPRNNHVRDKLRQQLQVLRKKGYVDFVGRGQYRLRQP